MNKFVEMVLKCADNDDYFLLDSKVNLTYNVYEVDRIEEDFFLLKCLENKKEDIILDINDIYSMTFYNNINRFKMSLRNPLYELINS